MLLLMKMVFIEWLLNMSTSCCCHAGTKYVGDKLHHYVMYLLSAAAIELVPPHTGNHFTK